VNRRSFLTLVASAPLAALAPWRPPAAGLEFRSLPVDEALRDAQAFLRAFNDEVARGFFYRFPKGSAACLEELEALFGPPLSLE